MSLSSLNTASAANAGRVMNVLHPEDRTPLKFGEAGEPITITLLGQDSEAFIKAEQAARNRQIENLTERVKFSAAQQDLQASETLARCTTAWAGIPQGWLDGSDDDTPVAFSYDAALKLYENPGVAWLKTQVDKFVGNRANFLKASPAS